MKNKTFIGNIVINAVMLLLGLTMVLKPGTSLSWLIVILGMAIIIFALVNGISAYKSANGSLGFSELALPVTALILGLLVIIFSRQISYIFFPLIIGAWAIFQGIKSLMVAFKYKKASTTRAWIYPLVTACVYILAGAIIVLNMISTGKIVSVFIGVMLIIFGITGLLDAANIKIIKHKLG